MQRRASAPLNSVTSQETHSNLAGSVLMEEAVRTGSSPTSSLTDDPAAIIMPPLAPARSRLMYGLRMVKDGETSVMGSLPEAR